MKKFTKIALIVASFVLVAALSVGGTIAWLTATTDEVTNTFVKGEIIIKLDEGKVYEYKDVYEDDEDDITVEKLGKYIDEGVTRTDKNIYQVIPDNTYDKDPKVTVEAASEKCYLFVQFTETGDPDLYYTYTSNLTVAAQGWTKLEGTDIPNNVWYRIVEDTDADQSWELLAGNTITVKDTVGQGNMNNAKAAKLEWKAYAVQFANITTPALAWAEVAPATTT